MVKKKDNKPSIVNEGFIDSYYCYKFPSKHLESFHKILSNNKCCIVDFEASIGREIFPNIKSDFINHLEKETKEIEEKFKNKKINIVDGFVASDLSNYSVKNEFDFYNVSFYNCNLKVCKQHPLFTFICKSIEYKIKSINSNNIYLNKNLVLFKSNFILHPIKVLINGVESYINVCASLYVTGHIIIHYSTPLKSIEFSKLYTRNNKLDYPAFLPSCIVYDDKAYDYYKYIEGYTLETAISNYNNFLIHIFKNKLSKGTQFTNYILTDYTNMPKEFNNASHDLKKDLYWLCNYPFGHLNQQEKTELESCFNKRFAMSIYSSLFTSTNARTVVAYTSQDVGIPELCELLKNSYEKHSHVIIYLGMAIELLMIKQSFYNKISAYKLSTSTSLTTLTSQYKELLDIKSELFSLTLGGYGSLTRLIEYLEKNLIDFLPQKNIENLLNDYRELISINESQSNQKRGYIISLLAVLFPILFGLDAIETLFIRLDKFLQTDYPSININLSSHSISVWIIIVVLCFFLIYSNSLLTLPKRLFYFFKNITSKIKYKMLIFYYRIKNKKG